MATSKTNTPFTTNQKIVIALLAIVQFTIILDFMVMAPLGDMLMKTMHLNATQFASAVSAYAFSAGISGLLAAGFADKYDRKKLLLFFYTGFISGTLICGLANSFPVLLFGRIVTGLFGGVMGAVSMAIITDLFSFEQRGRVMGFIQMAFAVSQVAGIPTGLFMANHLGWHAPFLLIVALSLLTAMIVIFRLQAVPVSKLAAASNPFKHLQHTLSKKHYLLPFLTTALLSIGGFMMMPFSTAFTINNVKISQTQLPLIYIITGIGSMIIIPMIGKISDKAGKLTTFLYGTAVAIIMVLIYTHLGPIPVWQLILVSTVMFAGVMSRMVPSQALMTAIPEAKDRGAFMSINSSLQQIAGGIASVIAGLIIYQDKTGYIHRFPFLGYVCIGVMIICAFFMQIINKRIALQQKESNKIPEPEKALESVWAIE